MAQSSVLNALIDKRAELSGIVADLHRRLEHVAIDLGHVDATLLLFDPTVKLTEIRPKQAAPARSAHFRPGEIARRCRDALRVAGPEGVKAAEVALAAMRDKGIEPTDAKLLEDFTRRMSWTLLRFGQEGLTRKSGAGITARWMLVDQSAS
jgi:hypothetical protein